MQDPEPFRRMFAPEQWSFVTKFGTFVGPPFPVDAPMVRGIGAVTSHLYKYQLLAELADELQPELANDRDELAAHGYTPNRGGSRFAALTEAMIAELYSILDGVRQVLFSAYRRVRRMQNESTHRMFVRASKREYGEGIPAAVVDLLATANQDWFPRLRLLRTENTHGQVGVCHFSKDGKISYMHLGIKVDGRALVIDDVITEVGSLASKVGVLTESVFEKLYRHLQSVEREVTCGTYRKRIYVRMVSPSSDLTFDSGRCMSANWFHREPGRECPLRARCGAFQRPVSPMEFAKLKPT